MKQGDSYTQGGAPSSSSSSSGTGMVVMKPREMAGRQPRTKKKKRASFIWGGTENMRERGRERERERVWGGEEKDGVR